MPPPPSEKGGYNYRRGLAFVVVLVLARSARSGSALVLARSARTGSESSGKKWTSARERVLKASAHGVVGATEGLLLRAFALPTSVRLEPGREGVWIIWNVLGVQFCPEDLVLKDRTRRTGPR